jgi:hypothetical protein
MWEPPHVGEHGNRNQRYGVLASAKISCLDPLQEAHRFAAVLGYSTEHGHGTQ